MECFPSDSLTGLFSSAIKGLQVLYKGSPRADCFKNFKSKECKQVHGKNIF